MTQRASDVLANLAVGHDPPALGITPNDVVELRAVFGILLTRPGPAHLSGVRVERVTWGTITSASACAATGDRAAFAELVDRYWPTVRARLAGGCGDAHTADDLAQEAFLNAWGALPSARVLGTTEPTARQRVCEARRRLVSALAPHLNRPNA